MTNAPTTRGRRDVKLAERIAHDIVMEIAEQGLKPGDRLPSEVLMAQQRGVSRASLREALRMLEAQGVMSIRTGPGGGPQLVELSASDFARTATLHFRMSGVTFRQVLEARVMLEPRIAEMAALHRTPEQIVELRAMVKAHVRATEAQELALESEAFHDYLAEIAGGGNPAVSLMAASLHGIFAIAARQGYVSSASTATAGVHGNICDAVEEGDAVRASQLMEEHMRASIETFEKEHPSLVDSLVPWLNL